jgi:transcriptional antiterminator RfaH
LVEHATPQTFGSLNDSNDLNDLNDLNHWGDSNNSNSLNDLNRNNGLRHWYVIYTKPHSEDLAREQLEKKDIFVFLPKIREVRFRSRKLQEMVQPLFPSYIFARFTIPDEYYDVKWARGVKRIVGSGDMPTPLDDSIVVFLREQVNHEGLIQTQPKIRQGDKVRVKQGPLEGLWGIVQGDIDGKGRVKVLMDILHAGAKIELPFTYVERYE